MSDDSEVKRLKLELELANQRAEVEKQKAEVEKQRAEVKKQRAEVEKQRAEVEKQRAEVEKQRAEAANQRAEVEKQRAEVEKQRAEELKELHLRMSGNIKAFSLSCSSVRDFRAAELEHLSVSDHIYFNFPWQGPNSEIIRSAWDSLRSSEIIPSDGCSIKNENRELHSIFLDIFNCLKKNLNLSDNAGLFHEVSMPVDGVRHDYVLSNGNLRDVGYPDISAIIEIKLPNKGKDNGEMQACRGLINAVTSSEQEVSRINTVSLFFDFESVTAYYFEDQYLQKAYRSKNCVCFPENWKTLETPPLGFQILCHVLSVPIKGIHEVKLEDDTPVRCGGTIFATSNYAVYALRKDQLPGNIPRDQEYVAKVLTKKDKHIDALIRLERNKNQTIHEFENFRPYSVFYPDLKIKDGFVMIRGTPLIVASKAAMKISELALFDLLKKVSIQLFNALFALNSNSWYHGDIRPFNIVLDGNNNAKLIDFTSSDIFECIIRYHFMQGQFDAFWPDQMVEFVDRPHLYMPRWDYESLIYSILYCALSPSESEYVFKNFDNRRAFFKTCEESPRSILRFCASFFSALQCLGSNIPDQGFKDSILAVLNEFSYN